MISVTQATSVYSDFSSIPPQVLEMAAHRGTEVHAGIEAHLKGVYYPPMPDKAGELKLDSLKRWCELMVAEVVFCEKELVCDCPGYHYIGHVDAGLILRDEPDACFLADWKTPVVASKTWEAQVAGGYWHLVKEHSKLPFPLTRCGAIMSNPKGGLAKMVEYSGRVDEAFAGFLSALMAYRYFIGDK